MFEVIVRRLRMPPFKTKLTPDFKMNWGRTYPKVDIFNASERERRPLQTFDVREFVKEKRKSEMNNLLGPNSPNGGALPFFQGMPDLGANPFGQNSNPLFSSDFDKKPSTPSFDVDEIVRKIDEQIAKIEEEEKRLKEADNAKVEQPVNMDKIVNNKDVQQENVELIEELFNTKKVDLPKKKENSISNPVETIKVDELDDDYFDDFFDE